MKRRILMVLSILLILVGIFILVKITASSIAPRGKGALQVTTNIKAKVMLNGKNVGATPLCLCNQNQTIASGTYDLKITPDDNKLQPFSAKVNINNGVLTAVERTFLPASLASSYILTLEKTGSQIPEIFIASVPDGALITIDSESKGATPFSDTLSPSEHEIEIEKSGFSKKTIRVRAVKSYKLVLNVILGTESGLEDIEVPTVTPAISTTPAPTIEAVIENSITIKETPTGFLRVRETPSTAGVEIGRVNPGEKYEFVDENTSWFQIKLADGKVGWISKTYSAKTDTEDN